MCRLVAVLLLSGCVRTPPQLTPMTFDDNGAAGGIIEFDARDQAAAVGVVGLHCHGPHRATRVNVQEEGPGRSSGFNSRISMTFECEAPDAGR